MTDISRNPIQRYSSSRNASGLGFSNGIVLDSEGDFVSYADYTALRDRIDELEADRDRDIDIRQGLRAQLISARSGNDPRSKYMPGMDPGTMGEWEARIRKEALKDALAVTIPSTSWGTEGLPQRFAEAIQALIKQEDGQ